jgi:acyl carrier protein
MHGDMGRNGSWETTGRKNISLLNDSSGRSNKSYRHFAKPWTLTAILMGLDSVELIMEVEKHFSISIPDQEAEKAYTVGKLVDCVAKILTIKRYDFTLRENTFALIKSTLQDLVVNLPDFSSTDKVSTSLDIKDKLLLTLLEGKTKLKLPGLDTKVSDENGVLSRFQKWFHFIEKIDFDTITWKKYVDIILAFNLDKSAPPIQYNSKYEIYIGIMRITVDKIGVDYSEIGIEKSFTDDLGVD